MPTTKDHSDNLKTTGQAVSPNYKWHVVGMLWTIAFLNYADRQAIFSLFPLLEREMHLDSVQLGLLGSSFAWVYGVCAPFAGNFVDRVRRKSAVLWGLQIWSVICSATALSRNFGNLLFFRAAEGLGETVYFPASMSMVSDYHGKRTRSRAIGIHQTSVYMGTIAGGFFAGLIGQYYGWRLSFVVFGSAGILLGILLNRFLREPKRGSADLADAGVESTAELKHRLPVRDFLKVIWGTPSVLLLMAAFMCDNFVGMVLLSWMPKFLYDKFSLSLAMAGLTATIFVQLASMVGSPVGGWMADVMRRTKPGGRMMVQAIGVTCGAPFVVLCGQTTSLPVLMVALTAWGFFKGLYDANIFASVFDVVRPEARGTAVGFMNMIGWLVGAGTAPLVIGILAKRESLSFAISIAAIAYIGAALLLASAAFLTAPRDTRRLAESLRKEAEA
jgi:MFS family permease